MACLACEADSHELCENVSYQLPCCRRGMSPRTEQSASGVFLAHCEHLADAWPALRSVRLSKGYLGPEM